MVRTFIAPISALLLALSCGTAIAQVERTYALVSVDECSPDALSSLPTFDPHGVYPSDHGIRVVLGTDDLARLDSLGCPYSVQIPDLSRYYRERGAEELKRGVSPDPASTDLFADPVNFRLGPVAGSYTLEEFAAITDSMLALYPEQIRSDTIGTSVQGRPIRMFTITAPEGSPDRPRALYTGLHHAREPVSMVNLVYTMWYLLENHESDPSVTSLLRERILHFVPVVNPDGYQRNLETAPQGGGLWRKNMRSGVGVDLNRNYGPVSNWISPEEGASSDPTSDNYRGPAPFSEPEILALKGLYDSIPIAVSLHHHSFGDVLLYGHDDHYGRATGGSWRVRSAARLSRETGCGFGPNFLGIGYLSSGTATAYARDVAPTAGYAWTAESGTEEDGFWPLPSRYFPLCRQYLPMNLALARIAGSAVVVDDYRLQADGRLAVVLRNVGTLATDHETVFGAGSRTEVIDLLEPDESVTVTLTVEESAHLLDEARSSVPVVLRNGGFEDTVELSLLGRSREILFRDDFEETLSRWDEGLWGIETAGEAGRVLGDSPYEQTIFSPVDNECTLRETIDLGSFEAAELRFRGRGRLQGMHYGFRIMARRPSAIEWVPLEGELLQRENRIESESHTVLRGDHDVWRDYRVSLDELVGGPIELRLVVSTDARLQLELSDGVQIDDVEVIGARSVSGISDERDGNRSTGTGTFVYAGRSGETAILELFRSMDPGAALELVDLTGRRLATVRSATELLELVGRIPSGVYMMLGTEPDSVRVKLLVP